MFLRKLAIRVLQAVNPGDITIRHHYTGDRLRLHSFRHKGYWYHGKRREQETMELFRDLVVPGSFIVEVGAHIGYVSLHLAKLVGPAGRMVVFEPGPNNLEYLSRNLQGKTHVQLERKAVADFNGVAKFQVENLSGQNNSLLQDYEGLQKNMASAGVSRVETSTVEVDCVSLDDYFADKQLPTPSFIKIDVEGAELMALRGLQATLRQPGVALMVEITENCREVMELLADCGYRLFDEHRRELAADDEFHGNVFCLQPADARLHAMRRSIAA